MQSNKTPCVFVQNNHLPKLYALVAETAQSLGYEVIDRSMIPDFDPDECGVDWEQYGPVLVYGSTDFVSACAKSKHLATYVFNDREVMSMTNLVNKCGRVMFNNHGAGVRLGTMNEWMKHWAKDYGVFIRPDVAHKTFNGGVYKVEQWQALTKELNLPDDFICWVSDEKATPAKEYRCWVFDGKIAGISQYKENGEQAVRSFSVHEVMMVFGFVYPLILALKDELNETFPQACVIDLAKPKDRSWSCVQVLEINCINSSGFYGNGNVSTILASWMDYLIEREKNETEEKV